MKQVKIILVALVAILMSVSVTSCMKGDDDPNFKGSAIVKCVEFYPPTFQLNNGQKLVLQNYASADVNTGEVYILYYTFDKTVQSPTAANINVTLYPGTTPLLIEAKSAEGPTSANEQTKGNAPLYAFADYADATPAVLFNDGYLVVPVVYWVKVEATDDKQKEELNKHSFILTYDAENIKSGDTELVLTLNHVINDGEAKDVVRDKYTSLYKAYNLSNAMYAFQNKAGAKPTKITVEAMVNASKNSLGEGASKKTWNYTIK